MSQEVEQSQGSPWRARLGLALKGACMGIADVIPGVSGGTIALILGIYQQFIEAIRSINPQPLVALLSWAASGFKAEGRERLVKAIGTVHLNFLIPLGIGIVAAVAVGAAIIPSLMERFPEIMRGLFFGLILASVAVPWRLMPKDNRGMLAAALVLTVVMAVTGYALTDPNSVLDTSAEWVSVEAQATDEGAPELKNVIRRGPSALTSQQVYWSEQNAPLREAIAASDPELAQRLQSARDAAAGVVATDKKAIKALAEPYDELRVPVGTVVQVPRPTLWFVFLAGAIAICAMVLPGVSGSFLLLVLGCYYFILNALKGTITQLVHGELPWLSMAYVGLFIAGIAVGILSFARVMSWLLRHQPALTMGALMGLMIGCLRAIWPFQQTLEGRIANVMPAAWGGTEIGAIVAIVVGVVLVVVLTVVGERTQPPASA